MIIIASKFGYLCNRILTFANTMAFAIENNITLLNPAFDEYCKFFVSTEQDIIARYPSKKRKIYYKDFSRFIMYRFCCLPFKIHGKPDIKIKRIAKLLFFDIGWNQRFEFDNSNNKDQVSLIKRRSLVVLSGYYFLDTTNLYKHADKIREYFKPAPQYQQNIQMILKEKRKMGEVLVGVHIRQNDYKDFCGGVYYYTSQEYLKIMQRVETLFTGRKVTFLICSDTNQNPDDFRKVSFGFGSGQLIEDLYSLAGCDYIIGPPSTFSGWASFYGNVPRLVMNDKERLKSQLTVKPPEISDFKISIKIHDN